MPKTYNNVQFYFSTLDGNYDEETGTVLVRPGEMVIDIPDPIGTLYLIVGKPSENFFTGSNTALGQEIPRVLAKWIDFGQLFIGHWREDGEDYLFSFRLPRGHSRYLGDKNQPE
jgi:hypothetical protein